jgi:hypothetical protein
VFEARGGSLEEVWYEVALMGIIFEEEKTGLERRS